MEKTNQKKVDARRLALATIQVVQMWSDKTYTPFLSGQSPGEISPKWFAWFVSAWKVARTRKKEHHQELREYLDRNFRLRLLAGGGANAVDAAAEEIQEKGWSSKGSAPRSLVSKVAFFLCPGQFVPMDKFSKDGLNRFRQHEGQRALRFDTYARYFEAFNQAYASMEANLTSALREEWVRGLAHGLECPVGTLETVEVRRKLFDDYLMHLANYRKELEDEG